MPTAKRIIIVNRTIVALGRLRGLGPKILAGGAARARQGLRCAQVPIERNRAIALPSVRPIALRRRSATGGRVALGAGARSDA